MGNFEVDVLEVMNANPSKNDALLIGDLGRHYHKLSII